MSAQEHREICGALAALALTLALVLPPTGSVAAEEPEETAASPQGMSIAVDPMDPLISDDFEFEGDPADPWEPTNRVFFGFNQVLDTVLIDPMTRGYQFVVPEPVRRAFYRFFLNLNSPSILVNDLLQGRIRDAGQTAGRMVLNTAFGWGGLFDVGAAAGWEYHHSDFGQTLALAGVKSGPYIVIPIFGPSTVRDGFGDLVDRMFQPLTYVLGFTPNLVLGGGFGLSVRDAKAEELRALKKSSVDFYSVLRSAYLQNREAEIWGPTHRDAQAAANMTVVAAATGE